MGQNFLDHVWVFNICNYPDVAAALLTSLYVNVEYPFEALRPAHGGMLFGKGSLLRIRQSAFATLAPVCVNSGGGFHNSMSAMS